MITRLNQLPKNSTGRTTELNNMAWIRLKLRMKPPSNAIMMTSIQVSTNKATNNATSIPTFNRSHPSILWHLESEDNHEFR